MPTILESIQLFNETRNGQDFLLNPGVFTTVSKCNVGEKIKTVSKFRVFWELVASAVTNDVLTVAAVAGGHSLTSANQNFETSGFRVGGTFDFIDTPATPIVYAGQTITLISGNYMEFTLAAALPVTSYTDAVIKGTTDLNTLTYNYNFTDSSNSQNLINDVFGLIPTFTFKSMIIAGGDIVGVAKAPNYWNGGSAVARRLTTVNTYEQVYEVETIIVIPDYKEGQFEDIRGRDIVVPFSFETQFFKEALELRTGENLNTSRPFDIVRSINDSVGWFNENFDGGPRQYSLVSLNYTELVSGDLRESIAVTESTKVSVVIASNDTTFTATDPATVSFRNLFPETIYNTGDNDYNVTNNRESLRAEIDGPIEDGTIITQLEITLNNPNEILVEFVIVFDQPQQDSQENDSNYLLAIVLENPSNPVESSNRINLIIDADSVTKNPDIPGLFSMTFDQVYYLKDEFEEDVTTGATDLVAWNESGIMRDIKFDITTDTELVEIDKMYALIIAYNNVEDIYFEIQRVAIPSTTQSVITNSGKQIQQIEADTTRGFLLPDDSIFNKLKVSTNTFSDPLQNYRVQVGMMVDWQPWEELIGSDPVFYNASEPNNGLNKKTSNYSDVNDYDIRIAFLCQVKKNNASGSPVITDYLSISQGGKIFDFDLDKNITPKYTTTIVYTDENDVVIPKSAIKNELVKVTATYDDGVVKTTPDFEAAVRIEVKEQGTEKSKHIISSVDGVIDNDVLIPLTGETLLKNSVVSDDFTSECIIDGSKLIEKQWSLSTELQDTAAPLFCFTRFNGVNEAIDCGNDSSLNFNYDSDFSVSIWAFFDDSADMFVVNKQDTTAAAVGWYVRKRSTDKINFTLRNSAGVELGITTTLTIGLLGWHNIVCTKPVSSAAANSKIYIDNVLQSVDIEFDTLGTNNVLNAASFKFGVRGTTTLPFDGDQDYCMVVGKELSAGEVTTIFNQGRDTPDYSSISNKISVWSLGELNPPDLVGSNDGTAVNMDASNIICE